LVEALSRAEAPTSVHRPSETVDVHVADSLSALLVPGFRSAARVADLGAGAGVPGLALAAALPMTHFSLVESNARKSKFISESAGAMGLTNVTVITSRIEEWRDGLGRHDFVCARALASLPILVEYAAPLLAVGGVLVAWKGEVGEVELRDGAAAAAMVGVQPGAVLSVKPFVRSERRTLHLFRKVAETPSRYPRRPGMAVKRPLSASTS
jgi:16S rRNA (guanine527-N7)-methyltransferase